MEDLIVEIDEIDACPVQIQGPKSKALMKDFVEIKLILITCLFMV